MSKIRTPKIYTTTGLGPRKNREMAGVDDLVVYMQTAVKYNTFYIHHPNPVVVYIFGVPTKVTLEGSVCREVFYGICLGPRPPFNYWYEAGTKFFMVRAPPGWCIYKLRYFTAVCIYTTKSSTPAISLFFLGPNPVVVYIFGVPIL